MKKELERELIETDLKLESLKNRIIQLQNRRKVLIDNLQAIEDKQKELPL